MLYLRAVLVRYRIQRAVVAGAPRLERPCRDIILQQLAVDNVDDCRDQGFDVLGSRDQGLDVACV